MTAHVLLFASLGLTVLGAGAYAAPHASAEVSAWWADCFEGNDHDDDSSRAEARSRRHRHDPVRIEVDADVDIEADADVKVRL